MTTGLVVVHSALILTAFLVMLNGCLRGSAKAGIDAVLSVVWLGLLGAVLIIFGWQSAVLGLALSFVYAASTRPIARSLARRMLGYRTTLSSDLTAQTDYSVAGMFRRGKETDERLEFPAVATGNVGANHTVVLSRIALEKHLKSG